MICLGGLKNTLTNQDRTFVRNPHDLIGSNLHADGTFFTTAIAGWWLLLTPKNDGW